MSSGKADRSSAFDSTTNYNTPNGPRFSPMPRIPFTATESSPLIQPGRESLRAALSESRGRSRAPPPPPSQVDKLEARVDRLAQQQQAQYQQQQVQYQKSQEQQQTIMSALSSLTLQFQSAYKSGSARTQQSSLAHLIDPII